MTGMMAAAVVNLAELYRATGRSAEAERLHKRSSKIKEKVSDENYFELTGAPL
jgi:hypothetical protein